MKQFHYQGKCESGTAISGTIEAPDQVQAVAQLTAMGLADIDVNPAGKGKDHETAHAAPPRRPLGADDFIFFNEQLASLAEGGMCLDVGLRQLAKDVDSRRLRGTVTEIADDLERGMPLDQSIDRHAGQLPALYARVIRAGIKSGRLAGTLLNLSCHLRLVAETRRVIVQTLAYPLVVATAAFSIFCLVLWFVVPQFELIFGDFDTELPTLTQSLIAFSRALPVILAAAGVIVAALIIFWVAAGRSAAGSALRERLILALPLFGRLFRDSIRARLLRALAYCVSSEIPLPESLRLAGDATGSQAAADDAERVAVQVETGQSALEACRATAMIPPMFGYVVQVSADRDNAEEALTQLSRAYAARAVHTQSLVRAWLGPLAVVVVGVMCAVCIVSLFLPLINLFNSFY